MFQAQLAEARQKVANLTRALITAGKLPDGGKQLQERIAQAEREVRRLEEEVRKRPGGAGPSGVSLVNQEWEAKRRELTGMGMTGEERTKGLEDLGNNHMYGGRMNQARKQEVRL